MLNKWTNAWIDKSQVKKERRQQERNGLKLETVDFKNPKPGRQSDRVRVTATFDVSVTHDLRLLRAGQNGSGS